MEQDKEIVDLNIEMYDNAIKTIAWIFIFITVVGSFVLFLTLTLFMVIVMVLIVLGGYGFLEYLERCKRRYIAKTYPKKEGK